MSFIGIYHRTSFGQKHSARPATPPKRLPLLPATLRPALGTGEREAICLAMEVQAGAILLDDEPARKIAAQLNLPLIGTAGVLILAKERRFRSLTAGTDLL